MDSILQTTLATVIQQLADFFGMTTEVIMQNAPMWLAKYGWFTLMQNLPMVILLWVLVAGGCLIAEIFIFCELEVSDKTIARIVITTLVLLTVFVFSTWFIQCAICPELYGLNALLNLIK